MVGSVCSGIGAPECAWAGLGWHSAFASEIEPFPRAVLAARFPGVPMHGDFTTIQAGDYEPIDLLVGGTPCQSFSVAGLRQGMADERGNLALEYLRLADRLGPKWLVWENVPGVLSSADGRDFGAFLGGLAELGYGWAYRVLDAQHFGVPQRRRRVFVVGYLGDWRRAAAVLFEPASMRGDPAPRREAREEAAIAAPLGAPAGGSGWRGDLDHETFIARCLTSNGSGSGSRYDAESETFVTHTLRGEGFDASEDGTGRGTPLVAFDTTQVTSATNRSNPQPGDPCHPLAAGAHAPAIAFSGDQHARTQEADAAAQLRALRSAVGAEAFAQWGSGILDPLQSPEVLRAWVHGGSLRRPASEAGRKLGDCALACPEGLPTGELRELWSNGPDGRSPQGRGLAQQLAAELGTSLPVLPPPASQVRRLTPREAERLQGFPDDWTLVPYRNRPAADGPRYKALGNSMAVPVLRWIGERIAQQEGVFA